MDSATLDSLIALLKCDSHKARLAKKLDISLTSRLSDADMDAFADVLLDQTGRIVGDYYSRLFDFYLSCNHNDDAIQAVGNIWLATFSKIDDEQKQTLLDHFARTDNHSFWPLVPILSTILLSVRFEPEYLAHFFIEMSNKIKGDMAGGEFYKVLELLCRERSDLSLKIVENISRTASSDIDVHLLSILLGSLRNSSSVSSETRESISSLERSFKSSPNLTLRKSYYFSFAYSSLSRDLSAIPVRELIDEILQGQSGNPNDSLEFLARISRTQVGNPASQTILLNHLRSIAPNIIRSGIQQYLSILSSAIHSAKRLPDQAIVAEVLDSLSSASEMFIPDQANEHGLVSLLGDILFRSASYLDRILDVVACLDRDLTRRILSNNSFEYHASKLGGPELSQLLGRRLVSTNSRERFLALAMLETRTSLGWELDLSTFQPDETALAILLLEIKNHTLLGEATSQLLISVLPLFEKAPEAIKSEFFHYLFFQAGNYPGACLETWKAIGSPSPILAEVIKMADHYFENLRKNELKFIPQTFPSLDEISKRGAREQSRKISEEVDKRSVFVALAHKVAIIYGESWATISQGQLGAESTPQPISHSVEFPRMEEIDPEGMMLQRMDAGGRIHAIEREGSKQ
ncbi:MAG: hypothetical protein HY960_03790 [Ignavibacteriae bacterium]|nr:hypothetical protein [Ignavibacteriota bacterium]